jgi:hypothetical protein
MADLDVTQTWDLLPLELHALRTSLLHVTQTSLLHVPFVIQVMSVLFLWKKKV